MKKLFLLPLFVVLFFCANAQVGTPTYINVVPTTSTNAFPWNSTTSNKVQWIYAPGSFTTLGGGAGTAAPIGMAISKIYIRISTVNATNVYSPDFAVSLTQTGTASLFSSATYLTGLTTVFQSTSFQFTGIVANSWYGFTCSTPFPYDPTLSLIVECKSNVSIAAGNSVNSITGTGNQRIYGAYANISGTAGAGLTPIGLDLISLTPCSGMPTAGTVSSASTIACPNTSFLLNLTGTTNGSGLSFQWDSSANGTTWVPITGATLNSYTGSQTSSRYYRCNVSCGANTATTASYLMTTNASPLAGTYTINSAVATGGTNFNSFTAFASVINCAGVSAPVIVNVISGSGPYNEQVEFTQIPGTSATNTVTINGNGESMSYSASVATAPHTFSLNGTDYMKVDNLIINGMGATYALTAHLWNDANNNKFSNCTFNCPANCTTSTQVPFSLSGSGTAATTTGSAGINDTIISCSINSGYYNTCIVGNSSTLSTGNVLSGCSLKDFYSYGCYNLYTNGTLITNNTISRPTRTTLSSFYGIYVSTGCVGINVIGNRLNNPCQSTPTSTIATYAIYCLVDGTLGNEHKFYNNLISDINSNGSIYAMYLSGVDYVKAYHNTISLDQTAATAGITYGIYNSGTVGGIEIKNNIVTITRGGTGNKYGLYYTFTFPVSNNNNVYVNSSGGTNGVGYYLANYVTLANWQAANAGAWDALSYSLDPLYASPSTGDYTPTNMTLNNTGANVGVATDILGASRVIATPDMGCYEFGNISCTSAGTSTITPTTYSACIGSTKTLTAIATSGSGISFQWKSSTVSGGPYTNVVGGSGATTNSYTTPVLATGTTYYVFQSTCANCGPCTSLSNEVVVSVNNVATPTGVNSLQCNAGIPTASVSSNAGAIGSGQFTWYSASTGGTVLQFPPFSSTLNTYYTNDFTTSTFTNSSIYGNASILGTGVLQLTPNATSQAGAIKVNAPGYNSNKIQVDFDASNSPAGLADGYSYNWGPDVDPVSATPTPAENGTGSKLKVCFDTYGIGTGAAGIYVLYNNSVASPGQTIGTNGVLAYSSNVTWVNTTNTHILITVNAAGQLNVSVAGTVLLSNIQLPTDFLTSDKSSWAHVIKARTGGIAGTFSIDNLSIQLNQNTSGYSTYQSSLATTTNFYVSEMGTNGCASQRVLVNAQVGNPTVTATPSSSLVCPGTSVTLTGGGAGTGGTYSWSGGITDATPFTALTTTTYTVTGTTSAGCSSTASAVVTLKPVLVGTTSLTPSSAICLGQTATFSAAFLPQCSTSTSTGFQGIYAPSNWSNINTNSNGTVTTSAAPTSISLSAGTNSSGNPGSTNYSITIGCAGTVSFSWSYTTTDFPFADYPTYSINGGADVIFPGFNTGGAYLGTQSGTTSIIVPAGAVLTLKNYTIDNDGYNANITISNFVAPAAPLTGTVSLWDAATGGTNLNSASLNATPTSTGIATYYAEYTTTNTGCVNLTRTPISLTVNSLPSVTASTSATTVCSGQPVTLNGAGASTYTWNNSVANNTSFNPTTTTTYQVTGTDANSCSSVSTITVNVNSLPTVTASASSSAVCAGQSVILTGGGATSYTWDNFVTNNTSFIPTSTTTYQVTGTDANTCSSVSTVQVVVNTLPTVTASTSASSVCAGQSVTLTGAGASSYIWNNSVTNNTAFTPTATTTYQVTGTDANTCSSVSTVTVTVNALPTITATPATQIICENTPASISGGGGSTYSWNNGITDNTPFTVTASNTYQVTGTDANGCTGIATATVTMTAAPVVTASMTPTTVCAGNTATATGSGALSYSWNNSILDNTTFVAPTSTTTYQVTGTDAGGCTAISSVTLTVNTASGSLVTASSNSTNTQPDGSSVLYTNTNCDIIALVNDGAGGNILGSTQSNVTMMPTVGVYNGQPYVRRWYEITPTNNGAATITLYLTQADFDDYNLNNGSFPDLPLSGSNSDANIANIRITKVSGGTLGIGTPTVITPTMNWNGSYWEATFPVTGFSQFYFHSVNPFNSALPVTITDFKGQKTTSSNLISWTTSNETNNAYFTITYSQDGKNYTSLKRINSQANQGNSTAAISYSYEHTTPVMGHNYYKLEQVDIDGQKTTNTNVVDLVWGANGSTVTIYPNPTNDELNIDIYSTKVAHTQLRVVDMSGRTVQEVQAILQEGANHLEMNLSTIATGVYTIQVLENNVVTQLHKVTKN